MQPPHPSACHKAVGWMATWLQLAFLLLHLASTAMCQGSSSASLIGTTTTKRLQCYACGMSRVHPEDDVPGSYGAKIYNGSCDPLFAKYGDADAQSDKYVRTCSTGVQSCFGATGIFDQNDDDPTNDLTVRFLGCSEAKFEHQYGCNKEQQRVDVRDKTGKMIQVAIEVNLCFCSTDLCMNPKNPLLGTASWSVASGVLVLVATVATLAANT